MKDKTKLKTERVEIRLTPKERLKLEDKASQRGETLSDYIRHKTGIA